MAAPYGNVGELAILVSREGQPSTLVSQLYVLVATGDPNVEHVNVGELAMLVSKVEGKPVTYVSEVAMLVTYTSEATERFEQRTWGFNMDQHQFYVLHLGVEGTLVYDVLTSQWAQWQTQGYVQWNAEAGIMWNNEVYFGSDELPTLWRMDMTSFLDEDFRPIKRVVTGGIPAEARETIRSGMFVLSAIKEGTLDDEGTPYVQLSISDDGGETYKDREQIVLNGSVAQDFSWRGLGTIKAPGRVFKITDEGGFVTIKGADQSVREEAGNKEADD